LVTTPEGHNVGIMKTELEVAIRESEAEAVAQEEPDIFGQ
jgi:hypothetical protein